MKCKLTNNNCKEAILVQLPSIAYMYNKQTKKKTLIFIFLLWEFDIWLN